jgi:hypothetical protein
MHTDVETCNSKKGDDIIRRLANRFLDMLHQEISNMEMRHSIKKKLVDPLLSLIYSEIYPYMYLVFGIIILILLFSLLTFVLFLITLLNVAKRYKTLHTIT